MQRVHIHVNATDQDFDQSVNFYSILFKSSPSKERKQYAKWMLEDPKINFVVEVLEEEGGHPGIHHVGIQVDESEELETIRLALKESGAPMLEVGKTTCCYSESEKNWVRDPSGVRWETFRSTGDVQEYGDKTVDELAHY